MYYHVAVICVDVSYTMLYECYVDDLYKQYILYKCSIVVNRRSIYVRHISLNCSASVI